MSAFTIEDAGFLKELSTSLSAYGDHVGAAFGREYRIPGWMIEDGQESANRQNAPFYLGVDEYQVCYWNFDANSLREIGCIYILTIMPGGDQ